MVLCVERLLLIRVVQRASTALEVNPQYLKALLRRAHSYEATEKYEEALQGQGSYLCPLYALFCLFFLFVFSDYKKVLELDPSQTAARNASMVSGVSDL